MKKWKAFGLAAILGSSLLAACGGEKEVASADEQDKVLQYQSQPGVVTFPEVAQELGYLDDVTLEIIGNYVGGPESIQLVATGQIDFGYAFTGAILKSAAKNVPIKAVIAAYGSDEATATSLYALEGSGIASGKDLIGKKVGVNTLGAHYEFFLADYLKEQGLTEEERKQVSAVVIPMATAEQTLRSGQIDAVIMNGLARDLALERGGIATVARDIDVYDRHFTAGPTIFSDDYIEENPHTVKTFVAGTAKAIDWLQQADKEEVIELYSTILTKRGQDDAVENTRFFQSPGVSAQGGLLTDEDFAVWLKTLEEDGTIKEGAVDIGDIYTNEFNPYAK
ncbi:ABC transporter substrate-binding protein [Caryophanon latum]|uniref:ABC transporter substrate-binding protein n=1 Tax=Caryophanon latum TaxID=33977 RepID=A0A1C0Z4I5_9BACL|nr:ABC transporter substrate-binding protein [Caryophanon latum]OCS94281.1 ABC transporter substrate-binding protein [Caryophanon latum]